MAHPPTDIAPEDLFRILSTPPRPSEVVDFPRHDRKTGLPVAKIRISVLDLDQHDQARIDADLWLKSRLSKELADGRGVAEVLNDRVAREILSQACLSVNPIGGEGSENPSYARIFPRADDLGRLLPDELETLWMTQRMIQTRYGPFERSFESDEEITAWMRRLVEGASKLPLGQAGWHLLVALNMSLAERAYTLSAILNSGQCSNLPPTLVARLTAWGIGTGSFGKLPPSAAAIGLGRSDLGLVDEVPFDADAFAAALAPKLPSHPIDTEKAAEMARDLFRHGE